MSTLQEAIQKARTSGRRIMRTYEPNCEFNNYCTWCGHKNWCSCNIEEPIGSIIEHEQASDTDLLLSAIATATDSKIQDNISLGKGRQKYLIVKNGVGFRMYLLHNCININGIFIDLSNPDSFNIVNAILKLCSKDLITQFLLNQSATSQFVTVHSSTEVMYNCSNKPLLDAAKQAHCNGVILMGHLTRYDLCPPDNIMVQNAIYPRATY